MDAIPRLVASESRRELVEYLKSLGFKYVSTRSGRLPLRRPQPVFADGESSDSGVYETARTIIKRTMANRQPPPSTAQSHIGMPLPCLR